MTSGREPNPAPTVKVWDLLVRALHWTIVLCFAVAFITGDDLETVHETAGEVIMIALATRLIWGFVGGRHARFTGFVKSPAATLAYLRAFLSGRAPRFLGHNPAGAAMGVALMVALAVTIATGYLAEEEGWGELFEEMHEAAANGTLFLVVLHLTGVLVTSLVHRENLVRAMITGRKRAE